MKNILLTLVLVVLFGSCSKSPEDKAKALIKDNLFKTLHDFDSYQEVEFSKLDSAFTDLSSVPQFLELEAEFEAKEKKYEKIKKNLDFDIEWAQNMGSYTSESQRVKIKTNLAKVNEILNEMKEIAASIDSVTEDFSPKFIGYSMIHKFRAKSLSGNTSLGVTKYTFNKDISEIININEAK